MGFPESYAAAASRWPDGSTAVDVPTSWGRTHVLEAGPAHGPTVVLLHGDGATATAWADVATELTGDFRMLAPDQPGSPGLSSSSRPFRATTDLVSWLDELLRSVSGPVHLAGHSAGAHLALSYALEHGQHVASLSLLDPTFCFAGLDPRYLWHALPTLIRPTPAGVRRFLGWETQGRVLDPAWVETYVDGATGFDRTPIVRTRRPDARAIAGLSVPLLVLVAARSRTHDPARVARNARAALPAATVIEVPRATHHTMPLLDAPELAAAMATHMEKSARP